MPHRISLQRVDMTTLTVDAIVVASNPALVPGGTVSAAVHRAAGPELAEALRQYPGAKPGDAVITPGFQLPEKYVIHAVGPSWWPGKEPEADTLAGVYRRSLALVANHGIRTVALSAISCGFYAYPLRSLGHCHSRDRGRSGRRAGRRAGDFRAICPQRSRRLLPRLWRRREADSASECRSAGDESPLSSARFISAPACGKSHFNVPSARNPDESQ